MASRSNSSSALVTSSRRNYYDVFVTFRGEDTRNNFTDFLFDALETNGIYVFRDDTNLEKGESIGPELLRSIEGSQVYDAVFSRNYASLTWCLQELEKIWECIGIRKKIFFLFFMMLILLRFRSKVEFIVKHLLNMNKDSNKTLRWCQDGGKL